MKILVTGGAGFIGSNFIRYILEKYKNYKIINLDKLTYASNPDNLTDVEIKYGERKAGSEKRYTFIKGDICDLKTVDKIAKDVDCLVNFAAETHVDRSIIEAGSFVMTDVFGTYNLLEAVKKYKIKRHIQISTDEVYGSIEKGSFTEESPLQPNSPYASSKAGGDLLCRSYFVTYKLPIIITRASNNFGPYQYPEKIVPLFVTNAIENKPLPLYGDGKNVRDWLYVLDHCEGIDVVLHKGKIGEVYNIGGGNEVQNIALTRMILNILDKPPSLIKPVADRLGHDRRYSLKCEKIKKLGWKPTKNFEPLLETTVKWYTENKNWWKKLKNKDFQKYYKKQYKAM